MNKGSYFLHKIRDECVEIKFLGQARATSFFPSTVNQ